MLLTLQHTSGYETIEEIIEVYHHGRKFTFAFGALFTDACSPADSNSQLPSGVEIAGEHALAHRLDNINQLVVACFS